MGPSLLVGRNHNINFTERRAVQTLAWRVGIIAERRLNDRLWFGGALHGDIALQEGPQRDSQLRADIGSMRWEITPNVSAGLALTVARYFRGAPSHGWGGATTLAAALPTPGRTWLGLDLMHGNFDTSRDNPFDAPYSFTRLYAMAVTVNRRF